MGDARFSGDKRYNPTPLREELSEEEKRKLREQIPRGTYYPRTYRKGQTPAKTIYFASTIQLAETEGRRVAKPDFAEQLIASIPSKLRAAGQRTYWERSVFSAYYHLYGSAWEYWSTIVPWVTRASLSKCAASYRCDHVWDWTDKRRFLEENDAHWSLADLEYLIDRFPERQTDSYNQGIYVADKSFEEIMFVAEALGLPTVHTLKLLSQYAQRLASAR